MKKRSKGYLLCILVVFSTYSPVYAHKKAIIAAASVGISIAGLYGFYRWLHSEEKFTPTVDNLNAFTFKSVAEADTLIPSMHIDRIVATINKNKSPDQVMTHISSQNAAPEKTVLIQNAVPEKTILIQKGVTTTKEDPVVFIFSRGYARTNTPGTNDNMIQNGGCAMAAYMLIQDHIVNQAPCITFDYPDRRRCFNFGQKKDTRCLQYMYDCALNNNPNAHIVLVGDCRGAKAILNFAAQRPKNIKALVLFSPFFSAKQLTDQIARNYLSWFPGASGVLHGFFKSWFPSYNTHEDQTFLTKVTHIAPDVPIFIAHRTHDTLVSTEQVNNFIDQLHTTDHHNIHLVMTDDMSARHSRLTPLKAIQQEVNRFFSQYELPHNPALLRDELV